MCLPRACWRFPPPPLPLAKTLERAYLLKLGDKVMERPQYMFMRIAIGIHGEDLKV